MFIVDYTAERLRRWWISFAVGGHSRKMKETFFDTLDAVDE
jgi:hypothetical protein